MVFNVTFNDISVISWQKGHYHAFINNFVKKTSKEWTLQSTYDEAKSWEKITQHLTLESEWNLTHDNVQTEGVRTIK